jgi:hypothetical protein
MCFSSPFSPIRGMIAQGFVFTGTFLTEQNNKTYFRGNKISYLLKTSQRQFSPKRSMSDYKRSETNR